MYSYALKWNVQLPLTEDKDLGNLILKSTADLAELSKITYGKPVKV